MATFFDFISPFFYRKDTETQRKKSSAQFAPLTPPLSPQDGERVSDPVRHSFSEGGRTGEGIVFGIRCFIFKQKTPPTFASGV
jgi:hypothetical protein